MCSLRLFSSLMLAAFSALAVPPPPADTVGKIVSPYPGATVLKSRTAKYEQFSFPVEPPRSGKTRKRIQWEGDLSFTFYRLGDDRSSLEAYRNYKEALERAGFRTVYDATGEQLGFAHGLARDDLQFPCYSPPEDRSFLLAGEKSVGGTVVNALVFVAACSSGEGTRVGVWLVEGKPMRTGQVTIHADELARRLDESGTVAIYGIDFDFGKADLKPTAEPILGEVQKLLATRPKLSLYVVGHTDMQGSMDYNLQLSRQRAASVVQWLTKRGVAAARLEPHGVGFLAPKGSNGSDAGRALNRRVELVERR